jgi:putative restriction endonuclease
MQVSGAIALFVRGAIYGREEVQDLLGVPEEVRGGHWDTGYAKYGEQVFIFANVGVPGRTGDDYPNRWDGDRLVWYSKRTAHARQPLMRAVLSHALAAHVFTRSEDRADFRYEGIGRVASYEDRSPIEVVWSFPAVGPSALRRDALREVLTRRGFLLNEPGVKTQRGKLDQLTIYLKCDSDHQILVVDPTWEDRLTELVAASAMPRTSPGFYYHNSTMRDFPRRVHRGHAEIPYGLDLAVSGEAAAHRVIDILTGAKALVDGDDPETETERLRAERLGQSKFRADLLEKFGGRCAVTGIDMPELLRASHIKAWSLSTDRERLDPNNGILLAVHIDGLFDRGLISFDDLWNLLVGGGVTETVLDTFHLTEIPRAAGLDERSLPYLEHHRSRHGF